MKKFLSLVAVFFLCFAVSAHSKTSHKTIALSDVIQNASLTPLSHVESRVRNSAVKVLVGDSGHGSGTYVTYKKMHFIITAAHVVRLNEQPKIKTEEGEEAVGKVVYVDNVADIAVILISKLGTRTPISFSMSRLLPKIGTEITYSGYPSDHDLLTFRGYVTGFENSERRGRIILIHSYGWPGVSGAGVFDAQGNLIGVAFAVDVGHHETFQLIEDVVWITPIDNLDLDLLMTKACKHHQKNPACILHKQKEKRKRFKKITK